MLANNQQFEIFLFDSDDSSDSDNEPHMQQEDHVVSTHVPNPQKQTPATMNDDFDAAPDSFPTKLDFDFLFQPMQAIKACEPSESQNRCPSKSDPKPISSGIPNASPYDSFDPSLGSPNFSPHPQFLSLLCCGVPISLIPIPLLKLMDSSVASSIMHSIRWIRKWNISFVTVSAF